MKANLPSFRDFVGAQLYVFQLRFLRLGVALTATAASSQADVLWREDFEGPGAASRWHSDEAVWSIAKPARISAHSGTNVLATIPEGRYLDGVYGVVVGPRFTVPPASENPRLRLWQWYSFNAGDFGEIQLSVGTNAPVVLARYEWTHNDVWAYPAFRLSPFAGERVQVLFYFRSANSGQVSGADVDWGWYIDDVEVVTGHPALPNPEGFEGEDVWDRWETTGGVWQIGAHGGPQGREGNQIANTILGGKYSDWTYSRLTSAPFRVPPAAENPRLRLWHWYSFNAGDYGQIEILAGTNAWKALRRYEWTHSDTWDHPALDLSEFAEQEVRLAFLFHSTNSGEVSGNDVDWGWYIDDVEVVTGHPALPNPEGFEGEDVWDRWETTGGVWQIGAHGGPQGREGNQIANTILGGKYSDWTYSRLISAPFRVPPAAENPRLRLWHWYSFNAGDYGQIEILAGTNAWKALRRYEWTHSDAWDHPALDLGEFAEQEVRLAFLFHSTNSGDVSGNDVDWGWYIDDIEIVTGHPALPNPEGFEGEDVWDRWETTGGVWQIGAHGGPQGREGNQIANTILGGKYSDWTYSRLISAPFRVPPAAENPRLRVWHSYSFNAGDYGQIEILAGTNAWKALRRYEWTHSDTWDHPALDLSEFAEQEVRLAFLFHSTNSGEVSGNDVDWGWYIDDVEVVTGHPALPNPEGFEGEDVWDRWETTGGVWQIGTSTVVSARGGSRVAATLLNSKYSDWTGSGLIGRPFTVPAAEVYPELRFYHWHAFNAGDSGAVRIKAGTADWQTLKTYTGHSSGRWANPWLDLRDFAGQTVLIGFWFQSANSPSVSGSDVDYGWYLDDVEIHTEALTTVNGQEIEFAKWVTFAAPEREALQLLFGAAIAGLRFGVSPEAPEGAAIDPALGLFSWSPAECQGPSTNQITITVTDPANPTLQSLDYETITVIVEEVNEPPVIGAIPPFAIQADMPVVLNLPNFVYDPDCPEQRLTYSLDACSPSNATVDPVTGRFEWTPTAAQAAQAHTLCLRVTDELGASTTAVIPVGTFPIIRGFRIEGADLVFAVDHAVENESVVLEATLELKEPPGLTVWREAKTFNWQANPVRLEAVLSEGEAGEFFRLRLAR